MKMKTTTTATIKIKTLKLLTVVAITASCSSMNHAPESIQEKMSRYSPDREDQFLAPDFLILKTNNLSKINNRAPASTKSMSHLKLSNKRLYFLSLLDQYYRLSTYSKNETPTIKMCPSFHSANLTYLQKKKSAYKRKIKTDFINSSKLTETSYKATYPILQLPVSATSIHPTVADILQKDQTNSYSTVHSALNIHIIKVYKELKTLCQYGTSDNYYSFENLITHIQTKKTFTSKNENLKILFKSPIFSNMTLLNSIEYKSRGRSIASRTHKNIYSNEIVKRLDIFWFNTYLLESKKRIK